MNHVDQKLQIMQNQMNKLQEETQIVIDKLDQAFQVVAMNMATLNAQNIAITSILSDLAFCPTDATIWKGSIRKDCPTCGYVKS